MKKAYEYLRGLFGLSLQIAKANFILRNEGSYLGILWYLLYPILFFTIIMFVRDVAFNSNNIVNYPLFLLLGLIMFNFFTAVVGNSTRIIQSNSGIIKSIKFETLALLFASLIQFIFSHLFELVVFLTFLIYFNDLTIGILFYPLIFFFYCLFILGLSLIFATIGVYVNDLKNIWAILSTLLLFATPIWYNSSSSVMNLINPLYYFITIAREIIIYNQVPSIKLVFVAVVFSISFFILGLLVFNKYKSEFGELI